MVCVLEGIPRADIASVKAGGVFELMRLGPPGNSITKVTRNSKR